MSRDWIQMEDELPKRGQAVWVYDSMMGVIISWTVVCSPDRIDGDISHWMPRTDNIKPRPPELTP